MRERVAIVTGAGGAIGHVIARALLQSGMRVVLTSMARERMDEIVERFADGRQATVVVADIAQAQGRQMVIKHAIEAFGGVDILINNAAITSASLWPDYQTNPPQLWRIDDALFTRLFEVNMLAAHFLASSVLPGMIERRWGRIVNITCNFETMHNRVPYGATKAALESYSAGLATNVAGTGVTVNVLVPGGLIATERNVAQGHRTIPAEVMAAPIQWLASDSADQSNGRKYTATKWDGTLPPQEAAAKAGAPIGWAHLS
jgi:NAD(P)-dependent dehydrogenase (short-subunit alcohol dehydrogenase family)